MEVLLVKREIALPKESLEVAELVLSLLSDIVAKKSMTEITAGSLPKLMTAVDGIQQLPSEAKHPAIARLGGFIGGEIGFVFLNQKTK